MARIEAEDCSAFSDQEAAEETLLTIVVPCHNEQDTINPFLDECSRVAEQLDAFLGIKVHYIFVDDGSSDATLAVLHHVCAALVKRQRCMPVLYRHMHQKRILLR